MIGDKMKILLGAISLIALTSSMSSTAYAGDKSDFQGCDGLKKPDKKGDGMQPPARLPSYGFSLPVAAISTVSNCTRALESDKLLSTHSMRKAHLLRARAAANLKMGMVDAAESDLNEAKKILEKKGSDPFFNRSIGVSFLLLDGLIASEKGQTDQANIFAKQASEMRPYSISVQLASAELINMTRPYSGETEQPWQDMKMLGSSSNDILMREIIKGNFQNVADMSKDSMSTWPDSDLENNLTTESYLETPPWQKLVIANLYLSYSLAVVGDADGAQKYLNLTKQKNDDAISESEKEYAALEASKIESGLSERKTKKAIQQRKAELNQITSNIKKYKQIQEDRIGPFTNIVNARIALDNGDSAPAATLLEAGIIPRNSVGMELIGHANFDGDSQQKDDAQKIIMDWRENRSKQAMLDVTNRALMVLESSDMINYKKSKSNAFNKLMKGIDLKNGFRSETNEDGSFLISFAGGAASEAMVEEMVLLRAAEIAMDANQEHFIVTDRKLRERYVVTSVNGFENSRASAGYTAELKMRYLDEDDSKAQSANAQQIIDNLGKIYYN